MNPSPTIDAAAMWADIKQNALTIRSREPLLAPVLEESVINHGTYAEGLAHRLGRKLGNHATNKTVVIDAIGDVLCRETNILNAVVADTQAVRERDPACNDWLTPMLFFKGFQALTAYRVAHAYWEAGRHELAHYLQSLISETFAVDIHPAARIGKGILLDHATSFVAGETAVIDDNVSILHEVTLGGTGKERGDRHPKVRSCVLLGAGAKILGNVIIGEGARVGAGSVVLEDVPPHVTVAGVPAKIMSRNKDDAPALAMDHQLKERLRGRNGNS
jgi:serine O-acetyltransferase